MRINLGSPFSQLVLAGADSSLSLHRKLGPIRVSASVNRRGGAVSLGNRRLTHHKLGVYWRTPDLGCLHAGRYVNAKWNPDRGGYIYPDHAQVLRLGGEPAAR